MSQNYSILHHGQDPAFENFQRKSTTVYRVVHQRLAEGGRTSRQRLTPREIESKGPSVSPHASPLHGAAGRSQIITSLHLQR